MILWAISILIILASYLTPFRISSYWRFLPFIKIPLLAGIVYFLFSLKNKKIRIFLIFIILLFSFVITSQNFYNLISQDNNLKLIEQINKDLPQNSKLFGNPYILYGLQALGQQSYIVAIGHEGGVNSQIINQNRNNIWDSGCANTNEEFFQSFDFLILSQSNNCFYIIKDNTNFERIDEVGDYIIYKVNKNGIKKI